MNFICISKQVYKKYDAKDAKDANDDDDDDDEIQMNQ